MFCHPYLQTRLGVVCLLHTWASHTCWRGLYHAIISGIRESVAVGTSRKHCSLHTSPAHTPSEKVVLKVERVMDVQTDVEKDKKGWLWEKKEKPEEVSTSLHALCKAPLVYGWWYSLPLCYDNKDHWTWRSLCVCTVMLDVVDNLT